MMEKIESLPGWLAIINRPHHHSLRPQTLPRQYVLRNGGSGLPLTCLHSNKQITDNAELTHFWPIRSEFCLFWLARRWRKAARICLLHDHFYIYEELSIINLWLALEKNDSNIMLQQIVYFETSCRSFVL